MTRPIASVSALSMAATGNLHDGRTGGEDECRANRFFRVNARQDRTIKCKLRDIGPRYLGQFAGSGRIGLVVGHEDRIARHRQPVDLAGNGNRRPAGAGDAADDRHLGAASGGKHFGKALIIENGEGLTRHLHLLGG